MAHSLSAKSTASASTSRRGAGRCATARSCRSRRTLRCSRCSARITAATERTISRCRICEVACRWPGTRARAYRLCYGGAGRRRNRNHHLAPRCRSHNHLLFGATAAANDKRPKTGAAFATSTKSGPVSPGDNYYAAPGTTVALNAATLQPLTGGGQPHNNLQPYLTLNFCIALQGIFPARN